MTTDKKPSKALVVLTTFFVVVGMVLFVTVFVTGAVTIINTIVTCLALKPYVALLLFMAFVIVPAIIASVVMLDDRL